MGILGFQIDGIFFSVLMLLFIYLPLSVPPFSFRFFMFFFSRVEGRVDGPAGQRLMF